MTCQHLQNSKCLIASKLAHRDIEVTPNWCIHCSNINPPQTINPVTQSLAKKTRNTKRKMDTTISTSHQALKERIQKAVKTKQRLISWLKFFKHISDRGIGDTAHRLVTLAKETNKLDAYIAINNLIHKAACRSCDAISKLNHQYPYKE